MKMYDNEHLISRYADPDLPAAQRRKLERLTAEDPAARTLLEQYRRLDRQLAELPDGLDQVDFGAFRAAVRRRLAAETVTTYADRRSWRRWAPLAAAAALAISFLSGWWLLPTLRTPRGPANPSDGDRQAVAAVSRVIVDTRLSAPSQPRVSLIRVALAPPAEGYAPSRWQTESPEADIQGEVICYTGSTGVLEDRPATGAGILRVLMNGST
ncbi:MAG: hypothetical protein JW810_10005 [Sedimentisphaerales bacterium]|nr:hypothetical protein [Sedimentisphaerales bacterium]